MFLGEVASLFLLVVAAALVAVFLSFPDIRQRSNIVFLPVLPVASFMIFCGYRLFRPEGPSLSEEQAFHGVICVTCITMFAAAPACWMFWTLRRHATTHPAWAGAAALLSAASIGLLMLKFIEPSDSIAHLLLWHIAPTLILTGIGIALGRKYLSW